MSLSPAETVPRRRRQVQFDLERTECHSIRRVNKKRVWYTQEEHAAIQGACDVTEYRMTMGCPEDLNGDSYRGIECGHERQRKTAFVSRAIQAVLVEQKRQACSGISDPELLATVYEGYVKISSQSALRIAKADARAAEEDKNIMTPFEEKANGAPVKRRFSLNGGLAMMRRGSRTGASSTTTSPRRRSLFGNIKRMVSARSMRSS